MLSRLERKERRKEKIEQKKAYRTLHKKRRRIIKLSVLGAIIAVITGCLIYVWPMYADIKENMYDILANMDETSFMQYGNTEIYDSNGNLVGSLGNEKYEYVDISDISEYVTKGYIAKEDAEFYTHPGINVKSIIRAMIALIKNKGEITQGGSTITQQVVKNNLLSQEQTYLRKITEILTALEIEKRYDKAKIMEFYCNSNYYGKGCYGIEGAAQYYFGTTAKNLTLSEATMLVATSNSPNNYNPVADYDLCIEKRNSVLDKMLEQGYITKKEYKKAKKDRPEVVQKSVNVATNNYMVTYALNEVTLKFMEADGFEFKYTFESEEEYETYKEEYSQVYNQTYENVVSGGYTIKTSFDKEVQNKLQTSVKNKLNTIDNTKDENGLYELQGAGICIDNSTGMIVAAVGGREKKGNQFNRAYQAKRQPGSSIKPLLDYGPAIDLGYVTPGSTVVDEKYEIDGYAPENAGGAYYGKVTIREALARSLNTVALQLMEITGREECLNYLGELGFSTITYADSTVYTTSLGGFTLGVTLKDMAEGYATLANDGYRANSTCLVEITDHNEEIVYEHEIQNGKSVYMTDTAFMLTDMMEGVIREDYGTASSYDSKQWYAVKTGTTNNNYDTWMCGYSEYYTTVTWMGYDTPRSMSGITGSNGAGSIWYDFMEQLHSGLKANEFEVPSTIYLKSNSGDNTKTVTYTKNIYNSRPSGYDYASNQLTIENNKNQELMLQKSYIKAAKKAVKKFEKYTITTTDEAVNLEDAYEKVILKINKISDADIRSALLERVAGKYESLSGEVSDEWQKVIDANENIEYIQSESNYDEAAQESKEKAYETYKNKLISNARWYIDELNERTVYTEYVEALIEDGYEAVAMCAEFDEYEQLYSDYNAAKEKAYLLPEPESDGEIYESYEIDESLYE